MIIETMKHPAQGKNPEDDFSARVALLRQGELLEHQVDSLTAQRDAAKRRGDAVQTRLYEDLLKQVSTSYQV